MVHTHEESVPYVLQLIDLRDLGEHRTTEHHGVLNVPSYSLGSFQLLREEGDEAPPCLSL